MTELDFVWPWLALLWPTALLVRFLPPAAAREHAVHIAASSLPLAARVSTTTMADPRRLLWWLVWSALLLAAMRPERAGEPLPTPSSGRDLLLVVDISGSMNTEDMLVGSHSVTRLEAVKLVVADFLSRRAGDRVGLIVFGNAPYVYVPLTFDRDTLLRMLLEVQGTIAGGRTALGDALALAVKQLRDRPADDRVVIVLTDGVNNTGEVEPAVAARIAADHGVRVHSIGFGADALRLPDAFGLDPRIVNPSSDLDEATLRSLASITGGHYFRARDTAALAAVYREIEAMEPVPQEATALRVAVPLYRYPLAAALLLASIALVWPGRRRAQPEVQPA